MLGSYDWLKDNLVEPLDAVSLATLIVALATAALAAATVWLALQTRRSVEVSKNALLADIRSVLADVPEQIARKQQIGTIRPNVTVYAKRVEIRVPLRNVGSGLGLLLAPELHTAALVLARSVTSTTLTSAVPAGEITDMIFNVEFADSTDDFVRRLHEAREFTVIARCRDMNGEQEIRTEATIIYTSTARLEGPTYSGQWSFGEVKLFHGDAIEPFAELPRSRTTAVSGGAAIGSASGEVEGPGGSDAGEGSPSE